MSAVVSKFLRDDCGATAIEYALIAVLVSIAGIGALTTMGTEVQAMFTSVAADLTAAVTP